MTRQPSFRPKQFPGILTGRHASVKRREGGLQIDIVLDLICPWCFIGKRRLERALGLRPNLAVTRSWRAFQLSPDVPSDGIPGERHRSAKIGGSTSNARIYANVCAAGRGEGIDFAFERIRRIPNTLHAHRLIRLAAAAGEAGRVVEALFQAHFLEGLDIGNVEVLAEIAARAGFDPTEARNHLTSEAGAEEVRTEERQARRLGIHAVPCFVLDSSYVISGAQEPEIFLPLFDVAAGTGKPDAPLR